MQRRELLERLGIGVAGILTGGYAATARGFAANELVNIGCIGTGARCRQLMETLRELPGVRIVAVCDVWDVNLEKGSDLAAEGCFKTKYMEELLARKDVDAVLIGSPDHWHVPMTIAACEAGKDVYVEKPLTHDLAEGQPVIDAQNKHKRVVQVGMQQRSMPHLLEAFDIVRSGELGAIHKVHLTWNRNTPRAQRRDFGVDRSTVDWKRFLGNAPDQPYDEYRYRQWRWFWDFGGGIFTDLMVHFIDVAHWFLGLDHAVSAASAGNWFMAKDLWETPDSVQTLLNYSAPETQVHFEGTFVNARNAASLEFMGTQATLYCDRGRYEIHPERNSKVRLRERVDGKGPRGADFYEEVNCSVFHMNNWLECIRTRKRPNASAEDGVRASAAAHLANLSLRNGQIAHWPV